MDDLDRLSDADLQALVRSVMASGDSQVNLPVVKQKKIRNGQSAGYKWENLDGVGLNQTVRIEIELPAYYVAGMTSLGKGAYREAVRDYLVSKGQTWWQPRFMQAIRAKQIEAYYRFTSRLR